MMQQMVLSSELVVNIPLVDVAWPVAVLGDFVEDLSSLAAVTTGDLAVDADVEELAVVGIGVARVLLSLIGENLRARELEHL